MNTIRQRLEDEYLVLRAKDGDRAAFEMLAARWRPKLVSHAWRLLHDEEQAKDAAQESWIEITRGLSRLQDVRAFPAWAFRIVSRRCARQIGQAQRDRSLAASLMADANAVEEAASTTGSDVDRLRAAIRQLPREQSAAIALFYLEELSVPEIAVALSAPAGTIKTRLMHARRKLREILEGEQTCETSTN